MLVKLLLTPVFYSVSIFEMRLDDAKTFKLSFLKAKETHVNVTCIANVVMMVKLGSIQHIGLPLLHTLCKQATIQAVLIIDLQSNEDCLSDLTEVDERPCKQFESTVTGTAILCFGQESSQLSL